MQDGIFQASHEQMMEEYTKRYKKVCVEINSIDGKLFDEFGVKRGLRDKNGKGVLSGITNISLIKATEMDGDRVIPCEGQLFYRGYNIYDLTKGFRKDNRFGFEETAYLLLFGELPTDKQLKEFQTVLAKNRRLPTNFVRDVIMKAPSTKVRFAEATKLLDYGFSKFSFKQFAKKGDIVNTINVNKGVKSTVNVEFEENSG